MRTHGVPNFPDPTFSGGGVKMTLKAGGANGIDPNSPQFKAAQKACQSLSARTAGQGRAGGPCTRRSRGRAVPAANPAVVAVP